MGGREDDCDVNMHTLFYRVMLSEKLMRSLAMIISAQSKWKDLRHRQK